MTRGPKANSKPNKTSVYRKKHHLCVDCGKPAALKADGTYYVRCQQCKDNAKEVTAKRKAHHECISCGKPVEYSDKLKRYYAHCPECTQKQRNRWHKWNTERVYQKYLDMTGSHKCECGINISDECNFCPWCGAEQPEEEEE